MGADTGGASEQDLTRQLEQLTAVIGQAATSADQARKAGQTPDSTDATHEMATKAAALDALILSAKQDRAVADERARIDDAVKEAAKAYLREHRGESLVGQLGTGHDSQRAAAAAASRMIERGDLTPHPAMKATFRDYRAGEFLTAMLDQKSIGLAGIDVDRIAAGKAALADLGVRWSGVPELSSAYGTVDGAGKATLGNTNSTGGYVLPNNLVDTLIKPNTQRAVLQTLVTVRNGVNVRGVDMPYRLGAPSRMTFQDWGATKENLNETYGSYTATLGTLARIYDISKQYARFSAGSAEQDVLDELAKAAVLGENYYMVAGAGTGSVGSGDPTYGIYTALNAASSFTGYSKTPTTSASSSTLLGSLANILTQAQGQLAGRNRQPQAWLVDHTTYFTAAGQGSDNAGFWLAPNGPVEFGPIPGFGRTPSGGLSYWGIPIYYDTNLGTSAATKILIGGEWDQLKLFRGMEFRIDTSDVANTRWDQNLIGFRGEEEIGFESRSAVNVGAFQMYTSVIP
jgi:HK97 family phage major capsid protein